MPHVALSVQHSVVIFDGTACRNIEMSRHNGTNSAKKSKKLFSITPFISLDCHNSHNSYPIVDRDSSYGTATLYGWTVWGSNPCGGRDFPHLSRPALLAHPASCTMGTGAFPWVKRPGRGVDHPPPPRNEVKERVELYLYFPSGPS